MNKLTTKQFADLCKVERRTLHYYDEIGLLKPVEVKENGYRIYHAYQFDIMSMIKALQSVGMSLEDIKKLMNENDLLRCKSVLNNQISLIREKQEELRLAEQILCQTTEQLEHYLKVGCNNFFKEQTPDIYLITQEIQEKKDVFVNYITNGYYLGVAMKENEVTIPQYVYKKAVGKMGSDAIKVAGNYACIYKSVPNGKISGGITSFRALLSSLQVITEGPFYVDSIANDFIRFPYQENIFKLSIKIK